MKFLEKYNFFWKSMYIGKGNLLMQVAFFSILIFSARVIIYNCWDSYSYYKAKNNLKTDVIGVQLQSGRSKENTNLKDIDGKIYWETNKEISTSEKNKFGKSTNHTILNVTNDVAQYFPAEMKKGTWFSNALGYEYQGIVTSKMARQYKLGKNYNIQLDGQVIKVNIIGILKWNYWIGDNYFGNMDNTILVYSPNGKLNAKYLDDANEIFIACEKESTQKNIEKLNDTDGIIQAYEIGYDDVDYASDIEEDFIELKFAVVLLIMSAINMILNYLSFWSVNMREIKVFQSYGATDFDIVFIVVAKWIVPYVLAYVVGAVGSLAVIYRINEMLPYSEVEFGITVIFGLVVLSCFSIGYYGFVRKENLLYGKSN